MGDNLLTVNINTIFIWVQIWDLPYSFHSKNVVVWIGSALGSYIQSNSNTFTGTWNSYMRIQVGFDICRPIQPNLCLIRPGGNMVNVRLQYERLPGVCFLCGMLKHGERFCPLPLQGVTIRRFGPDIRASQRCPQVVRIGDP